jgi:hypothetical protein
MAVCFMFTRILCVFANEITLVFYPFLSYVSLEERQVLRLFASHSIHVSLDFTSGYFTALHTVVLALPPRPSLPRLYPMTHICKEYLKQIS